MVDATQYIRPRWRAWLGRVRGIVLRSLLVVLSVVALLLGSLLLAPVRGHLLEQAVVIADRALPGTLTVQDVRWPALGTLELRDVLWVVDDDFGAVAAGHQDSSLAACWAVGDTLAKLDFVHMEVDLGALRRKDVQATVLQVAAPRVNVPGIVAAFPAADSAVADTTEPAGPPAFPRPGAIPGIPSIGVDRWELQAESVTVAPGQTVYGIRGHGQASLLIAGEPRLVVEAFQARYVQASTTPLSATLESLRLALTIDPRQRTATLDSLVVSIPEAGPPETHDSWRESGAVTLHVEGSATWTDNGIGARIAGDCRLPGPPHIEPLLPGVLPTEGSGPLAGFLDVTVEVQDGEPSAEVRLDLGRADWVDRFLLSGGLHNGAVRLDTLDIALMDAWVTAAGTIDTGTVDLQLGLGLDEPTVAALFVGGPWDDLQVDLEAAAVLAGPIRHPRIDLALDGAASGPATILRHLTELVAGEQQLNHVATDRDSSSEPDSVQLCSLHTRLTLQPDVSNSLVDDLLFANGNPGSATDRPDSSRNPLGFLGGTAQLDTLDLRLLGARVSAAGSIDTSTVDLQLGVGLDDPTLPALLLNPIWQEAQVSFDLRCDLVGATRHPRIDLAVDGAISGPLVIAEDLAALVSGQRRTTIVAADADGVESDPVPLCSVRSRVTLQPDFIDLPDSARATVRVPTGTARLDTLGLTLLGARISAVGAVDTSTVDLHLEVALDEPTLLALLLDPAWRNGQVGIDLRCDLAGPVHRPRIDLAVDGAVDGPALVVSRLAARVGGDRHEIAAHLEADGPLQLDAVLLDSVRAQVTVHPENPGSRVEDLAVGAWGPAGALQLGGAAFGDSIRSVRLDSLIVQAAGQHLRTTGPATLTLGPAPGDVALTRLELTGDPGDVFVGGHWTSQGLDLDAAVDLLLPEAMLQILVPNSLWSTEGGVDLALKGQVDLAGTPSGPHFDGDLRARLLPHRNLPSLGVLADFMLVSGDSAGLGAELQITAADTTLLRCNLTWPGQADLKTGTWQPASERGLHLEFPPQGLDLAYIDRLMPAEVAARGRLELAALLDATLLAQGNAPTDGADTDSTQQSGLLAGTIAGSVKTDRVLLDLPNSSRAEINLSLELDGQIGNPSLKGRIEVVSGFIRIPEIPRSLLPYEGRSLLWQLMAAAQAGQDSLTHAMTDSTADNFSQAPVAVADSLISIQDAGLVLQPSGPRILPDMDLKILVPNNLRIHGYGLSIELEGDLDVSRGYNEDGLPQPVVRGNVGVREGTLKFMNRMFQFNRNEITFEGSIPVNPRLNLQLESDISGAMIRILIVGRADDPVIQLTSEPEMNQADIMSWLVFGRTTNDLDTDQRGRMQEESDPAQQLRENLAGLAMVFGTAGLQNRMSTQLGVDMVEVGADSDGGSTLVVGKYLSPKILLKYNASLEKSGTYYMTLDYALNRYFKIITTYGQGDEGSGLELSWIRRY